MRVVERGQLDGDFEGFEDTDRVYTFFGSGSKWRQKQYHYHYHYAFMPQAQVVERQGRHFLEVAGVGVSIEVERVW